MDGVKIANVLNIHGSATFYKYRYLLTYKSMLVVLKFQEQVGTYIQMSGSGTRAILVFTVGLLKVRGSLYLPREYQSLTLIYTYTGIYWVLGMSSQAKVVWFIKFS